MNRHNGLLYERLVSLSRHIKVGILYALFEAEWILLQQDQCDEEDEENEEEKEAGMMVPGNALLGRQVFERGYRDLKSKGLKEEV